MKVGARAFNAFLLGILFMALVSVLESNSQGAEIFKAKMPDCHTLNGKGGAVGPNLTYVGGKRSRDYIVTADQGPEVP